MAPHRILITTFGSLGDLHPYLAIGQELARRGHEPVVATMPLFRERVEAAGLAFRPLRAATVEGPTPELMREVLRGHRGIEYIVRQLVMPALRTAYQDTLAAAEGVELMVTHPLTFATPLVAESRRLPWISTVLAPTTLLSAYDPPVLPRLEWLQWVGAGPAVYRPLLRLADRQTRRWLAPVDELRKELGLPDRGNPLFAGGQSPFGILALFSRFLGEAQPDWPRQVTTTGFPFFAQERVRDPGLEEWLGAGPAPVLFTLGSSAVMAPGNFFRESAAAARQLGVRALLVGDVPDPTVTLPRTVAMQPLAPTQVDGDVLAVPYASYAQVFPRAAAIVHPGGIGTTAEAMRAGRPMLVVPFANDQPDNAARVVRLGVGRSLGRRQYRAGRVAAELKRLLGDPAYGEKAAVVGAGIRAERGAEAAAYAIEAVLPK